MHTIVVVIDWKTKMLMKTFVVARKIEKVVVAGGRKHSCRTFSSALGIVRSRPIVATPTCVTYERVV